jgi:hypothetical protein
MRYFYKEINLLLAVNQWIQKIQTDRSKQDQDNYDSIKSSEVQ